MSRKREFKNWTLDDQIFKYDLKFDPIKSYLKSVQRMTVQQGKELHERCRVWDENRENDSERPEASDFFEIEIMNNMEFSDILNQSIYLTIYSIFEMELFELCNFRQKIESLKIGPNDIKGHSYIGKCKRYITHVLDVNLDSLNEKWAEIKKYHFIRNTIAHNNGIVSSPKNDILTFIENSEGILFD